MPTTTQIPYSVEPLRALRVFGSHLFCDPHQFVRELVSNAIDACATLGAAGGKVRVSLDPSGGPSGAVVVSDDGTGLSPEVVEGVLPKFFASTKSGDEIGSFGIGLYSALQFADQVCLTSRQRGEPAGRTVVLSRFNPYVEVSAGDTRGEPGTTVVVTLATDAPAELHDPTGIADYLKRVFSFAPVDVYFDGVPVGGPSAVAPPWEESGPAHGYAEWSPLLARLDPAPARASSGDDLFGIRFFTFGEPIRRGSPPKVVRVIRDSTPDGDYALYLTDAPIWGEYRNLGLYARRVYVCDLDMPSGLGPTSSFVTGVVNGKALTPTIDRQDVVRDAGYERVVAGMVRVLTDGLGQFAATGGEEYARFATEHREALLAVCCGNRPLARALVPTIPLRTLSGERKTITELAPAGGIIQYALAGVGRLPRDLPGASTLVVFSPGAERRLLAELRAGLLPGVGWAYVEAPDPRADDEPDGYLSNRASDVLRRALRSRPSRAGASGGGVGWGVRKDPAGAIVVRREGDDRAAWLTPVLAAGFDAGRVWGEALERNPGGSEATVRREVHGRAYDPVLYLNQAHPLVEYFFTIEGSARGLATEITTVLMRSFVVLARDASAADWPSWGSDAADAVDTVSDLAGMLRALCPEAADAPSSRSTPGPQPAPPPVRPADGRLSLLNLVPPGAAPLHNGSPAPLVRRGERVGRNDPCPCRSGKKYKNCCKPGRSHP